MISDRILAIAVLTTLAAGTDARASLRRVPQDHPTITSALAAAAPGDSIWVDTGTYSVAANGEVFPIVIGKNDLRLMGAGAGASVLDAGNAASVIVHSAASGGRVSGFTITGGSAPLGGVVQILSGNVELDHNRFVHNGASVGGASVSTHGTAAPWIHHNVFLDSYSTSGADVHALRLNARTAGVFEHNLVAHSDGNGLLTVDSVTTQVRNNIFFRNGIPSPPRGRGICWISDLPARVRHNLFFANQAAAMFWSLGGGDYDAAAANDFSPIDGVFANLEADPMFVDAAAGDFHLLPSSPAVDAGDPTAPTDADGTRGDIGPFPTMQLTSAPPGPDLARVALSPNPARDVVEIRLALAGHQVVDATIVDVLGRVVRRFDGDPHATGELAFRWDVRDETGQRVPAGLYFVQVLTEGGAQRARLAVVR